MPDSSKRRAFDFSLFCITVLKRLIFQDTLNQKHLSFADAKQAKEKSIWMQKAQGWEQYAANKKSVGIARNSYLSLNWTAPVGTPNPAGLYVVLASWFQTVVLDKDRGGRCPYPRLSERRALVFHRRRPDEQLIRGHLSGGSWGAGKMPVI